MGNGEDSGTWGSISNTNWNLMEQAVSGVQTVTMSNANYTLSNLNGVSDEARNMVLVVNGANSGVRQIIAPLVNKFYVVSNQTSGGYAITIGGASGSVISIPNATTVQVYCDGTNFYSAQTSSAGDFNVNGNETISGNLTVTGTNNIFPSGTRMVFAQAAAPTGFTQVTDDTANNRMMRVVSSTGGGVGGSSDPTLMNVVPYHTHSFTTGGESANHFHNVVGSTGGQSADHYHDLVGIGADGPIPTARINASTIDGQYATTGNESNDHSHGFNVNSGYISNGHVHSGGTDGGSSQTNWTPRYIDMIICTKN